MDLQLANTILASYSASFWLKDAIKSLSQRDKLDAQSDLLTLAKVFELQPSK